MYFFFKHRVSYLIIAGGVFTVNKLPNYIYCYCSFKTFKLHDKFEEIIARNVPLSDRDNRYNK